MDVISPSQFREPLTERLWRLGCWKKHRGPSSRRWHRCQDVTESIHSHSPTWMDLNQSHFTFPIQRTTSRTSMTTLYVKSTVVRTGEVDIDDVTSFIFYRADITCFFIFFSFFNCLILLLFFLSRLCVHGDSFFIHSTKISAGKFLGLGPQEPAIEGLIVIIMRLKPFFFLLLSFLLPLILLPLPLPHEWNFCRIFFGGKSAPGRPLNKNEQRTGRANSA